MRQDQLQAPLADTRCHDRDHEFLPRSELQRLQLARLQHIIGYVYTHVEYYRHAFTAAGLKPDMLKSLEDLTRFPFTLKDDLRAAYPLGMLAVERQKLVRIHASSGTTGKPTIIGYTAADIDVWSRLMARSMVCAGIRPGDIVHNAHHYGLFTGGFGIHYGAERLGCLVIPMSGGNTDKQVMLMHDLGANVLGATPSYALNIAEHAIAAGVDLAGGPLRIGLLGGEPSSESMRRAIEAQLGIKVIRMYGLSEIMGPGIAVECGRQDGLHGWEDHFLFEIIDPGSGQVLPCGERGELVITTLSKEAQPMIRYRTHDITSLTREPCACGRAHLRITPIAGRNDDMLIIRGVNIYPSQVEAALLAIDAIAPHYQLVIRREGTMDTLEVKVELAPDCAVDPTQLGVTVHQQIKSILGISCEVEILDAGELPRSEGKAVRVCDLRNH